MQSNEIYQYLVTKYKVVEEVIYLDALRREKEGLEAQLAEKEPSEEELVETGKYYHPYYHRNIDSINSRILEIKTVIDK